MAKKNVVITGGAKGIGKAICEKFAKEGYDIIIVDFDEAGMLETKKELESNGTVAHAVKCDISNLDNVKEVAKLVEKEYGYLTTLVNNAAIAPGGDPKEISLDPAVFARTMNINVNGPYNMIISLIDLLLKAKDKDQVPSVVNVASTAAFSGGGGSVAYAASKGAVGSMTGSIARFFGDTGLRINAVAPTLIMTPLMAERFKDDPQGLEDRKKTVPLGRFMDVTEVADIVYFLNTPSFIHGEVVIADGGRSLSV
ncbi:SDR family NAD(P)-dependent oxidoreductase [Anaerofustis stercorihominis]|uniref:SDR family NAD(P)-dependent oxidoreductase n=1 Tax=Anaerofustis stercorihominis TaxID=214853 RepID=UPI002671A729|nr:SDR family oxidoreductase [Anaerofustis stercorihominis]